MNILTQNFAGQRLASAVQYALYELMGNLDYDVEFIGIALEYLRQRLPEDVKIDEWLVKTANAGFRVTPQSGIEYNSPLYNAIEVFGMAMCRVAYDVYS